MQLVHLTPSNLGVCLRIFHTYQELKILSNVHSILAA